MAEMADVEHEVILWNGDRFVWQKLPQELKAVEADGGDSFVTHVLKGFLEPLYYAEERGTFNFYYAVSQQLLAELQDGIIYEQAVDLLHMVLEMKDAEEEAEE